MTREEIAQIHKALQESNEKIEQFRQLAARQMFIKTAQSAIEQIEQNKAAMEILSKEYYQSPDKLKLPLDVEI